MRGVFLATTLLHVCLFFSSVSILLHFHAASAFVPLAPARASLTRICLTEDQVATSMEIKPASSASARSTGLALALDDGTRKSHSVAENTQFVTGFFKGISTEAAFSQLVAGLYYVYEAMEDEFDMSSSPPVKAIDYPSLRRIPSLRKDMVYFFGEDFESAAPPSPATKAYVARVRTIARDSPHLLVAHMYTRYLGDLFGGQMMGGMARSSLGLSSGGTDFYEFEEIRDSKAFIESWYAKLNELDLTDEEKEAIVDEGNLVFSLNIDLFNELEGKKRAVARALWRLFKSGVKSRFSRRNFK